MSACAKNPTQLKSRPFHRFERAAENTLALVIPEGLDHVCPTEGKRAQEGTTSFRTLLNCLDGVGRRTVLMGGATNDPTCHPVGVLVRIRIRTASLRFWRPANT